MSDFVFKKVAKRLSPEQQLKRKQTEVDNLRKELDAARKHITKLLLSLMLEEEKRMNAVREQQRLQLEIGRLKQGKRA